MSDLTWSNFAVRGEAVEVEEFLWGADIGSVIFEMDPGPIKNSLFSCLSKFEKYPGIQNRSLQLLQDCHILTPTGITNDELITKFDVLLRTLSSWCDNVEVVLNLFQLLAMIADRDIVRLRCCQVEETEMLQYLERAMRIHTNSKPVQRSGLQLFEEILRHAKSDRATYQILKKVFQIVLENLMLNINDPAICHSSFSILFSLADQQVELLLPWIDHLINLTMTTIANLHSSEVVFKCLLLLDKLADDDNNLISIAAHERGLMALCDAMGILAAKHLEGAVIALRITFRALEDVQVTSILLSQPESKNEFLNLLTTEITMKFEKFLALTTEYGLGPPKLSDALLEELFLKYHQVVDVIAELLSVTSADCSEAVVAQVEVRPTPPKPSAAAGETEAQIIAVPVLTKAEEKAAERRNGRLAKAQLANAAYADEDDATLKKQADSEPASRASTGTASAKGKKDLYIDTGSTPENKKAKGRGLRSSHYYSSSDEDISAEETEENTEEVPMSPEVDEYMRYLQAQTRDEAENNTGNENQTDGSTEHKEEKEGDDLERLSSVHSMTDDLRYSNDNTMENNNVSDNALLRTTSDHLLSSLSKSNDSEIFNLEKSAAGNDTGESRPDAVCALNSHSWEAVDVAVPSNAKRDIVAEMRAGLVIEEQHEKAEDGPTDLKVNIPNNSKDSSDSSPQKRGTSPTPLTPKKSGNNLITRKKSDQNMGKLGSRSGSSENLNQTSPGKRTPGAWSPVKEKVLTAKERIALRMSEKNKPKVIDSDSETTSNAAADALSAEAEAARETAARADRVRQFAQQADKERQIAAEREREAQEERDRVAAVELQEKERKMAAAREEMDQQIAAVNAEKERLAAQQAELERQAVVQAEKQRLLAVQMEEARLAAEAQAEADREEERQTLLQAERNRLAAIAEAELQRQLAAEEAAKRERQAAMDAEVARQAAIHAEIERQIAIAQAAEEERQAAAQAEVDRLAAVKAEQERQIAAAQAELSRLAAIQAEKEHQIALAEAERERLAAVQAEADRQAAVQAELERQMAFAQAERDRQAAVAAEALRLAAVQAEKEREIAAAQAAELERQAAAQAELDRLTAIQAEKERQIAAAQAEMDRIAAEQARREREAAAQAENDRQMAAIQAEEERQMAEAQSERERQQAVEAEVNRLAEKDRQAALQAERERQMVAVQAERDRQMVAAHAEKERKLTAQAELDRIAAVQNERDRQAVVQAEKDRQIATAQAEIQRQAVALAELSRQMAVAQAERERLVVVQTEKDIQSAAIQSEKDRQIAVAVAERERQAAAQAEIDRLASVQAEKDRQSAARLLAAAQSEKEQQILAAQAETQRQAAVVADLQRQLSAAKQVPPPPPSLPPTGNSKYGEKGASEERKESSELSVDVQFVKEHAGDIARSVTDTELVEMVSSLERSQQQTASALLKADAMHKLFMDAAKKIEDMVLENDQLWSRVREAEEAQYRITVASNENEDEEEGDEEQYDHNDDHIDDHSQQDSPHSNDGQHGATHDAVQFDQIYRVSSTESKESVHGTGLSSVHSVHGSSSKKGSNPMMNLNSAFASPNPKTNSSRHVTYSSSSSAAHHRQSGDHPDNVLSAHLTSPQLKAKIKYRRLRLRKTHTIYGGPRHSSAHSHNDQYHHSSSPAVENCRQSLAVAGILEALDQITLSEKPSSGNALATGDGTTSEESVFSADNFPSVQHLAAQLSLLFKHSKENTCEYVLHMKDAVQRSSSIPIKALKVLIRRLNLIDNVRLKHHDVDLILSTLQVKTVSVFGVAYCVILCAQRRFKSHSGVHLVQQLSGLVTAATQQIEREIEEYNSRNPLDEGISESAAQYRSPDHSAYHTAGEDDQSVYTHHSTAGNTVSTAHTSNTVTGSSGSKPYNNLFQMSSAEFRDVLKLLEAEKRAFITIYEAYAIRINPNSSNSSNVSSGGSGRFSTSSHIHHGNSSHTPSSSSKATIKLSDNSYTLGLSFLNIVQFAFDFQISPELINRSQLAKIFNKLVDSSSGGGGSVHSIHSNNSNTEESPTITFLQFLDLIVLIATRCPIFRGANSPLVKISNFLMLMNQSTGKERISERSRSSALVVFRVNPVHTLSLSTTPSTDQSDNHSQYSRRSNGSSNHSFSYSAAPYDYSSHSGSHFSPQKQNTSSNSSRHNTFSGGSDKKVDMQLLSPTKLVYPTTKPYFDPKTQSIVQGRRKKHVSELRGMISGDDLR